MDVVFRYIYNNMNNIQISYINQYKQLNKYCSCKSIKLYIPDTDAYGYWIMCGTCNCWCGWYYECEYYNREGKRI